MSHQIPIQAPQACFDEDPFIRQGCRDACTFQTCQPSLSYWSYLPSYAANGLFLALFALSLIAFMVTNVRKGVFIGFSVSMILGNVLEILGYTGRILAHQQPFAPEPFLLQIIGLTLAPAFYAGGIYVCLSRIITAFGAQYSRIPPGKYPVIFIFCDVVALALQGAGGGLAASSKLNDADPTTGANVLIAGLSFQVFTMSCFIVLVIDFAVRARRGGGRRGADGKQAVLRASPRFRGFLGAIAFATVLIFARCVYRVAELSEGYSGHLAKTQGYFIALEGSVVVAAVWALNINHPAFCDQDVFNVEEEQTLIAKSESTSQ